MKTEFVHSDPGRLFALRQLDKFMEGHKGFIAGGCFKNLFSHERIKDVDVFFETASDWGEACDALSRSEDFEPKYTSDNVIAFKHKASGTTVELVRSIFGSPEHIIRQFDFTVTKFAYYKSVEQTSFDGEVTEYKAIYHPQFFEHLHLKRCIVDDSLPKPMSTFNRLLRYVKYGYLPCTETKQKLIEALRALPDGDIEVPLNFYNGID